LGGYRIRIRWVVDNDESVENNDFLGVAMDFSIERIFIE
jgi:hypothetical protein